MGTNKISSLLRQTSSHVDLDSKKVGVGEPTYFIAEIGNNHNGDFFLAKKSIEEAAQAGANAVKFQKRSIAHTFARELREKPQTNSTIAGKNYGEYRQALELDFDQYLELKDFARAHNISFFATPFDIPSVDFLEKVNIPFYKISSFDVTNLPLIRYVSALGKPIILSTGMATVRETAEAVQTILQYHNMIVLLHCVSIYPTNDEDINLGVMQWLKQEFHPLPIGYSGHEPDILPSIVAISQGAAVIERHFTLSKLLPGPDHATVSIEPTLFQKMIEDARRITIINGSRTKKLLDTERTTRDKHGKSIVSAVAIPRGVVVSEDMLAIKSPGYGLTPKEKSKLVGMTACVDIDADSVLRLGDFKMEKLGAP